MSRTYTCDMCKTTEVNPENWIEISVSPFHRPNMRVSDFLETESELHYCTKCFPEVLKYLHKESLL